MALHDLAVQGLRGYACSRNDRRNEQRRNVEFKFSPDKQLPPDASSLEWTVHGLLG